MILAYVLVEGEQNSPELALRQLFKNSWRIMGYQALSPILLSRSGREFNLTAFYKLFIQQ